MYDCCPICNSILIQKYASYMEDGRLCEEEIVCKNKCYKYEFFYGSNRETIFNNVFSWSYNTSEEDVELIRTKVKHIVDFWKKDEKYIFRIIEES